MEEVVIPTWRHPTTNKVHLDEHCQAVRWYRSTMTPGFVIASDVSMLAEMAELQTDWCDWCLTRLFLSLYPGGE